MDEKILKSVKGTVAATAVNTGVALAGVAVAGSKDANTAINSVKGATAAAAVNHGAATLGTAVAGAIPFVVQAAALYAAQKACEKVYKEIQSGEGDDGLEFIATKEDGLYFYEEDFNCCKRILKFSNRKLCSYVIIYSYDEEIKNKITHEYNVNNGKITLKMVLQVIEKSNRLIEKSEREVNHIFDGNNSFTKSSSEVVGFRIWLSDKKKND